MILIFTSIKKQDIQKHGGKTRDDDRDTTDDKDYYSSEIYTQRFYKKHVYEGKDFTMIFTNPGVDGMKYFSLFDNTKRVV